MHTPDNDHHDDNVVHHRPRFHVHYDDDGCPDIDDYLNRPGCLDDDCPRQHVHVTADVDRAADQRTRDAAIVRAVLRSVDVYDGRPRRVPVTLDDIIADAEAHLAEPDDRHPPRDG